MTSRLKKAQFTSAEIQMLASMQKEMPWARVYLVGGAVRDALLGRGVKDIDFVVCNVSRQRLERWLKRRGRVDLAGERFGVFKFVPATVSAHGPLDIAFPRREHANPDSRGGYRDFDLQSDPTLPIEEDLSRRDFTINAMAYDLHAQKLIDPFRGKKDLARNVIRAVGMPKQRFKEDLSRVLRAIRFAVELSFTIEPKTWNALKLQAPHLNDMYATGQRVVPRETIGRELAKALACHPQRAIKLLGESGIFSMLFPELKKIPAIPSGPRSITANVILVLHHLPPNVARRLIFETGLSSLPLNSSLRVKADQVGWILSHLENITTDQPAVEFERLFMNARGDILLEVLTALNKIRLVRAIRTRRTMIEKRCGVKPGQQIPRLISGDDIVKLGIAPGPRFREILDRIRSAQLEGEITSKADAKRLLKSRLA